MKPHHTAAPNQIISVTEVAQYLQVHPSTIQTGSPASDSGFQDRRRLSLRARRSLNRISILKKRERSSIDPALKLMIDAMRR